MNEALRVSKGFATQDFTTRVDPNLKVPGDWLAFKEALNNIGVAVSDAVSNISVQVTDLAASAEEANASVEEVSAGAGQVAKNTSAVSVNVEKSMAGIDQVQKAMEDLSRYHPGSRYPCGHDRETRTGYHRLQQGRYGSCP